MSTPPLPDERRDDGTILVFVLVVVILISLISVPILGYITSVFRFNNVQADRSQAVELANGGVWVALSNERDLYDACPESSSDSSTVLETSLDGVDARCFLLDDAPLRPATEVPFHVSTIAADAQVPSVIAADADVVSYTNPSTAADPSAWLADRTSLPQQGSVWIPQLPVQATSDGENRITEMPDGAYEAGYSSCRVFFPGTYNAPIVIAEPAYFTSGVYSFTQPITLRDGADVVVGNGTASGCTNDFEAVGNAVDVPDQLNMSGLGGTFVLGGDARITVDDAGGDDIRFVINQRYVSSEETNVAASSDVAIVSVNGAHEPFYDGEQLGDPFYVEGVTDVAASTVDTEGDPAAASSGYVPSALTVKPGTPDVPTNVTADDFRIGSDGRITVSWTPSFDHGAPVLFYTATDSISGQTCRTLRPARAGAEAPNTCTMRNIPDGTDAQITVTATNQHGTSDASVPVAAPEVVLSGGSASPEVPTPTPAPTAPTITAYADGALVAWTAPTPVDGAPIGFSEVSAVDTASGDEVTCRAGWNEDECALLTSDGFDAGATYRITVRSFVVDGDYDRVYVERAPRVAVDAAYTFTAGSGSVPQPTVTVSSGLRTPPAIIDFSTSTATSLDVRIAGYVAVPQGRIELDAASPDDVSIAMTGGLLAGSIDLDAANVPAVFDVRFDNPTAQKRVRIVSNVPAFGIRADAVIQVNRSGSLAINSWVVGPANDTTTPAPDSGGSGDDGSGGDDDDTPYVSAYTGGGAPGVDYSSTFAGDPSGASAPHACSDASRWAASFWDNPDLIGPAEVERCQDDITEDWGLLAGPTGSTDQFSARFVKTIDFPDSNIYDFTIRADDGVRLWIDGELLHDDWNGGDATTIVPVEISAGEHVVEIEYYEASSTARVEMSYEGRLACTDPALPWLATFYDGIEPGGVPLAQSCDSEIDFDWGSGAGPTGAIDNFSGRWVRTLDVPATADYQILLGSDDGIRLFVDGILIYGDSWGNRSYAEDAFVTQLAAGEREIRVEYYENGGDARVKFDLDMSLKPYVDTVDDDAPIAHWRLDEQATGGGGGGFSFVDDLETFTGWNQYRNGNIRAETSIVRSGSGSIIKDDNNDPSGGWKSLGGTLSGDFVVEAWAYRATGWSGGASDRFGIEDANHNGYSISVTHTNNRLRIDRRAGGGSSGYVGGTVTLSSLPQDDWYRTVLSRTGDVITAEVFDGAGNLLGSTSGTDTSTPTFDRFVVHGGNEYYLDDISVTSAGSAVVQPSVAADRIGLVDGSVSGNPTFGVAPLIAGDPTDDSAVDFDAASGDAILIPAATPLNLENRETRTLEMWVSIDDAGPRSVIYEEGGSTNGMNLYVENGNLVAAAWSNSTGWSDHLVAVTAAPVGTTHHVVVVLDAVGSRSLTLYVDGQEVDSATKTDANVWASHSDPSAIGTVNGSTLFTDGATTVSTFFDGRVDEVAVYNSALSAGRVAVHYATGA